MCKWHYVLKGKQPDPRHPGGELASEIDFYFFEATKLGPDEASEIGISKLCENIHFLQKFIQ